MPTDPSLLHGVQAMPNHPAQPFMSPAHDPSTFYRNSVSGVSQPMHPQHGASSLKQRQQQFLSSLAKVHESRKTPLPPSITGIPTQFDPNTSQWKNLEPSSEVGGFKLAGRDIDLLRLWTLVLQFGGSAKLTQQNAWSSLLPHFGLPERFATPSDANTSTAQSLSAHFSYLLGSSEEMYYKNMQARMGQGQPLAPSAMHGVLPTGGNQPFIAPHTPQMRPGAGLGGAATGMSPVVTGMPMAGGSSDMISQPMLSGGDVDSDPEARKRKLGEAMDLNGKRRKTGACIALGLVN
jgi:SWI/SNF chromatin-remodeling complex subunit SWI1